jgi:nitroimidazol reductase NimA-like FMN-containing flavoprotein (pyridoxamine 5'-phosphate oxidase superfamily)
MAEMTEAEWRAFLTERPRTGKLATVRADGRPHVAPIWFDLDDDGRSC